MFALQMIAANFVTTGSFFLPKPPISVGKTYAFVICSLEIIHNIIHYQYVKFLAREMLYILQNS